MQEPTDTSRHEFGPWWANAVVGLFAIAGLLIAALTGLGTEIVLGAVVVGMIVGFAMVVIGRVRRHNETLRGATAAVWRDRIRLDLGSRRHTGRAGRGNPPS
jgi:hypothetical protein